MSSLATLLAIITLGFVVTVESPEDIQKGYHELTGKHQTVYGYATFDKGTGSSRRNPPRNCVIHVPPLNRKTLSIWRHEIRHCKEGYYHK